MGCVCSNAAKAGGTATPPTTASNGSSSDPLAIIKDTPEGAKADYKISDLLGKGSFGNVYKAHHKKSGEVVAIKVMDRQKIKATSIHREWNVLEHIGAHEYVVQYKGTYKTKESVSFVLELMEGGELFDRLIRRGAYTEAEARVPFRHIAEALAYLHSRGIIHRDLKPENLLLKDDGDNPVLKIADFGLSQLIGQNERLLKVCGTWAYAAPEMSDAARPGYDCRFDCFSFGVILFVVLSGYHPFDPTGNLPVHEIKQRARAAQFDFNQEEWSQVSDRVKDLIRHLIVKDPDARYDSATMLTHPWFSDIVDPHLEVTALMDEERRIVDNTHKPAQLSSARAMVEDDARITGQPDRRMEVHSAAMMASGVGELGMQTSQGMLHPHHMHMPTVMTPAQHASMMAGMAGHHMLEYGRPGGQGPMMWNGLPITPMPGMTASPIPPQMLLPMHAGTGMGIMPDGMPASFPPRQPRATLQGGGPGGGGAYGGGGPGVQPPGTAVMSRYSYPVGPDGAPQSMVFVDPASGASYAYVAEPSSLRLVPLYGADGAAVGTPSGRGMYMSGGGMAALPSTFERAVMLPSASIPSGSMPSSPSATHFAAPGMTGNLPQHGYVDSHSLPAGMERDDSTADATSGGSVFDPYRDPRTYPQMMYASLPQHGHAYAAMMMASDPAPGEGSGAAAQPTQPPLRGGALPLDSIMRGDGTVVVSNVLRNATSAAASSDGRQARARGDSSGGTMCAPSVDYMPANARGGIDGDPRAPQRGRTYLEAIPASTSSPNSAAAGDTGGPSASHAHPKVSGPVRAGPQHTHHHAAAGQEWASFSAYPAAEAGWMARGAAPAHPISHEMTTPREAQSTRSSGTPGRGMVPTAGSPRALARPALPAVLATILYKLGHSLSPAYMAQLPRYTTGDAWMRLTSQYAMYLPCAVEDIAPDCVTLLAALDESQMMVMGQMPMTVEAIVRMIVGTLPRSVGQPLQLMLAAATVPPPSSRSLPMQSYQQPLPQFSAAYAGDMDTGVLGAVPAMYSGRSSMSQPHHRPSSSGSVYASQQQHARAARAPAQSHASALYDMSASRDSSQPQSQAEDVTDKGDMRGMSPHARAPARAPVPATAEPTQVPPPPRPQPSPTLVAALSSTDASDTVGYAHMTSGGKTIMRIGSGRARMPPGSRVSPPADSEHTSSSVAATTVTTAGISIAAGSTEASARQAAILPMRAAALRGATAKTLSASGRPRSAQLRPSARIEQESSSGEDEPFALQAGGVGAAAARRSVHSGPPPGLAALAQDADTTNAALGTTSARTAAAYAAMHALVAAPSAAARYDPVEDSDAAHAALDEGCADPSGLSTSASQQAPFRVAVPSVNLVFAGSSSLDAPTAGPVNVASHVLSRGMSSTTRVSNSRATAGGSSGSVAPALGRSSDDVVGAATRSSKSRGPMMSSRSRNIVVAARDGSYTPLSEAAVSATVVTAVTSATNGGVSALITPGMIPGSKSFTDVASLVIVPPASLAGSATRHSKAETGATEAASAAVAATAPVLSTPHVVASIMGATGGTHATDSHSISGSLDGTRARISGQYRPTLERELTPPSAGAAPTAAGGDGKDVAPAAPAGTLPSLA